MPFCYQNKLDYYNKDIKVPIPKPNDRCNSSVYLQFDYGASSVNGMSSVRADMGAVCERSVVVSLNGTVWRTDLSLGFTDMLIPILLFNSYNNHNSIFLP